MAPPERQLEIELRRTNPHWYSQTIVRDRPVLAPKRHFNSKETAAKTHDRLMTHLKRDYHTVYRETRVWTVYVVEVDPSAVAKPGQDFIYVVETSLTPEEQFKQHRDGARNKRTSFFTCCP
jgi:hypothetical protein